MQKLYYSISEVSDIVDEEQHILRYWEKEFDSLRPKKRGGNRIYSRKDLDLIFLIKKLIREDKISVRGAKDKVSRIIENKLPIKQFLKHSENGEENYEEKIVETSKPRYKSYNIKLTKEELTLMKNSLEDILEFLKT